MHTFELQYVENSLRKVRREVGDNLSEAGNIYSSKLTVLWRLSGNTSDFAEIRKHVPGTRPESGLFLRKWLVLCLSVHFIFSFSDESFFMIF